MHSIKANSILRIEPFSKRVQIACALLWQINNIKAFPTHSIPRNRRHRKCRIRPTKRVITFLLNLESKSNSSAVQIPPVLAAPSCDSAFAFSQKLQEELGTAGALRNLKTMQEVTNRLLFGT